MSLIKLAIHIPIPVTLNPFKWMNFVAAKSGNPVKWWTSKDSGFARKLVQESGISTASNLINTIRSGRIPDSTKNLSAYVDANFGHTFSRKLGDYQKIRNSKVKGPVVKYFEKQIIKKDGQIDIPKLEKQLKRFNTIHNKSNKIANKPLTMQGMAIGGLAGAAWKPDENGSRKKNIYKGIVAGGTVGAGIKKSFKSIRNILDKVPEAHNNYFADTYWRDRIHGANTKFIPRKVGSAFSRIMTRQPKIKSLKPSVKTFNNGSNEFTGMP